MFSLNSLKFSDKKNCHYSKRALTCNILWKRPGCYHSTSKTHETGSLSPIHTSVIYQIQWIRWIQWMSVPFRENSIVINTAETQWCRCHGSRWFWRTVIRHGFQRLYCSTYLLPLDCIDCHFNLTKLALLSCSISL